MSENKCCGNCKSFIPSIDGFGACTEPTSIYGVHCNNEACSLFKMKSNNGWTEITPDNVKELYKTLDRVIIAHIIPDTIIKDVVAYEKPNELYRSLEIIAAIGGYYYYVLPELNIE